MLNNKNLVKIFGNIFIPVLRAREVYKAHRTEEFVLSRYLKLYRRSIKRRASGANNDPCVRVALRRHANEKSRQVKRRVVRSGKRQQLTKGAILSRLRPSHVLDTLYPARALKWKKVGERPRRNRSMEISLEGFSFIENPNKTLNYFRKFAEMECEEVAVKLHFEDEYCIDIAPYIILAEIWPQAGWLFDGGLIQRSIHKVIEAVGLRRALGMKVLQSTDVQDVWAFELHRRHPAGTSTSSRRPLEPQSRDKVATKFCDAINVWLGEAGDIQLTEEGRQNVAIIILELLDNAERHSEPATKDGSWLVAGFMAKRKENDKTPYRCYMSFVSVGATIAEGLQTAPSELRAEISDYCNLHRSAGFSEEALSTLYALQDGVTRDPAAASALRGGIGFQDVMAMMNALGGTQIKEWAPRMTIVSGRACIQLRPPHNMGVSDGQQKPRVLWCNAENDPHSAPDRDFVFDLDERFGGTIVALSFVIDPEYLGAVIRDENNSTE